MKIILSDDSTNYINDGRNLKYHNTINLFKLNLINFFFFLIKLILTSK